MGDIVQTEADEIELSITIAAHAGIERIELRNGANVLETIRPYTEADLGNRVRVIWSGAEYRGRGRDTQWRGRAQFTGATITGFETINLVEPGTPVRAARLRHNCLGHHHHRKLHGLRCLARSRC